MKYHPLKNLKQLAVVILLSSIATGLASADPDTSKPVVPHRVQQDRRSDATAPTTKVTVTGHNEYQNGEYVWVARHTAQAPVSKSPYTAVHWESPGYVKGETGMQPGHWSSDDK